jgi:hypothetical protein
MEITKTGIIVFLLVANTVSNISTGDFIGASTAAVGAALWLLILGAELVQTL